MLYFGTIEDKDTDPYRICRYKVRVLSVHSPLVSELSIEDLPWATPIQNNSAGVSGIGTSPTGYLQGSTVAIVFADEDMQIPLILGSIAGISNVNDYTDSDIFDTLKSDFGIVAPEKPPEDNVKFADGTIKKVSEVKEIPVGSEVIEAPYIGSLTNTEIGKLSDSLVSLRDTAFDKETYYGLGKFQHTTEQLISTGLMDTNSAWTNFKNVKSKIDYLKNEALQVATQVDLFKNQFNELSKLNVITSFTPKEKLGGLLLSSNVNGSESTYKLLTDTICTHNDLGEACSDVYKQGYNEILSKPTQEIPTKDNINVEAVDKYSEVSSTNENINYDVGSGQGVSKVIGFKDPTGKYPLPENLNESDIPRLTTGTKINETIVGYKEVTLVNKVEVANSTITWKQSPVPYNSQYPYNNVYQSPSGHVMEFDDTPGAERINIHHKSGTFMEVDTNGNETNKTTGIKTVIVDKDELVYIKGSGHISVDGDISIKVKNALNIEVSGNANIKVSGNLNQEVNGNYNLKVSGDMNQEISGHLNHKVVGSIHQEVGGHLNHKVVGDVNMDARNIWFNSGKAIPITKNDTIWFNNNKVTPIDTYTPKIDIPKPMNRDEQNSIELEDTTIKTTSKVDPVVKDTNNTPAPMLSKVDIKNELPIEIFYHTRLSTNFNVKDMCKGVGTAYPFNGQHNLSAKEIATNLKALCLNCLEPIKNNYLSLGFKINSGIRPSGNPFAISGKTSQHELGQAADISFTEVRGKPNDREEFYNIAGWIKDNVLFDQLIFEYNNMGHVWIHISYSITNNRQSVFTVYNGKTLGSGLILS